eukprot:COSAG05_NODE_551_length_8736_cov_5.409401_2_plen_95_part_00
MAFWKDEESCSEKHVHFHFDSIFQNWWDTNEPLFRRNNHSLLGKAAGRLPAITIELPAPVSVFRGILLKMLALKVWVPLNLVFVAAPFVTNNQS